MKNQTRYKYILLVSLLFIISIGCSSDDDGMLRSTEEQIQQVEAIAKSGTWSITSYIDSGDNETGDYAGYSFSFNNNGSLVATNGGTVVNGSWSVTRDSSDDSNDSSDIDFNISFSSPPAFEELSDDWDIVSSSASRIELIDISGGNGGTDTLTFQRN